jgi:hypothetical protein
VVVSGPSCSNHSFSAEFGDAEIDIWIWRILALGAHQNSGPSPIPLREGVISPWVSPFELASTRFCQFLPFLMLNAFMCRVLGVCTVTRRGSPCPRMRRGGRLTVPTMKGGM